MYSTCSRYKFTPENLKLICDDLELVDWSDMFEIDDLESACNGIISVALFYPLLISLLPLSLRHLLHTANRILITLRTYSLEKECCGELGVRVKP